MKKYEEVWKLEAEFPENVYWVDSYERLTDWESWE